MGAGVFVSGGVRWERAWKCPTHNFYMDLVKSCDMRVLIIHDDGSVHEFAAHSRDFVLVETAEEHMP